LSLKTGFATSEKGKKAQRETKIFRKKPEKA
jgi:hypothetical protein